MSMTAQASNTKNYVNDLNGGVASILDPGSKNSTEVINATVQELNLTFPSEEEISSGLVMANVRDAVNVRSDASEDASKVGKLYKDCGGTILERRDGWTKIQSGTLIGWAKDEYLLFDRTDQHGDSSCENRGGSGGRSSGTSSQGRYSGCGR